MTNARSTKFLGRTFIYTGTEFPWMRGLRVRMVSLHKGAALPGYDPESDGCHLSDDEGIAAAGGIEDGDRVEVRPWMRQTREWSWVTSDPKAEDLRAE